MRSAARWGMGVALVVALAASGARGLLNPSPVEAQEPGAAAPVRRWSATPSVRVGKKDGCYDCHRQLEGRLAAPTRDFPQDIHAVRGLGCAGCHGGDPNDPEMTGMDPDKGFRGAPARKDIAELCASCHASATYMKHFNPKPYIFSMAEFRTSVHCKLIEEGDPKVATCTNCHGVHGILPPRDPRSPVHPTNVPFTCTKCHNAEYMADRKVRKDQLERYRQSVHAEALLEKGDLSAPACNDCHGNHGAVPPETRDISLVCANCHGREGELFAQSKVKATLEYEGKRGCATCHDNHAVKRPTDAMIGVDGEGVCGRCHEPDSPGARATAVIVPGFHAFKAEIARADSLLSVADRLGMETGSARELLKEASDRLVGLRAEIHSFALEPIQAGLTEGMGLAGRAEAEARGALRDWRIRRVGMALSLVVILAVIGLLVARIRRLERGGGREAEGTAGR